MLFTVKKSQYFGYAYPENVISKLTYCILHTLTHPCIYFNYTLNTKRSPDGDAHDDIFQNSMTRQFVVFVCIVFKKCKTVLHLKK